MNRLTRREFAVAAGASAAAVAAPAVAQSKGGRIVVVGGGFGGASAAKYAKMFGGDAVEVTLIEPNKTFYTCPFSNLVLGGLLDIGSIGHGYDAMKKRGVKVVHDTVTGVDHARKTVNAGRRRLGRLGQADPVSGHRFPVGQGQGLRCGGGGENPARLEGRSADRPAAQTARGDGGRRRRRARAAGQPVPLSARTV